MTNQIAMVTQSDRVFFYRLIISYGRNIKERANKLWGYQHSNC